MTVIGLDKDYITYVGSLVILDVACCYLWLFSLHINIKMGNNSCKMFTSSVTTCMGNSCSPGCHW